MKRRDLLKLFGLSGAAAAIPTTLAKAITKVEPTVVEPTVEPPKGQPYTEHPRFISAPPIPSRGRTTRGNLHDCTIIFRDGNNKDVTIHVGEGNLTWSQHCDFEYRLERGKLDEVYPVEESPLEVWLDITYKRVESDAMDWLDFIREARPDELDMFVQMNDEWFEFRSFWWESMDSDLQNGELCLMGKCMGM